MYEIGGDFDGILGFSEGASIVELADRLVTFGRIPRKWKFSVLISACHVKARGPAVPSWLRDSGSAADGKYLQVPSVHVVSSEDYLFRRSVDVERGYQPELRQVVTHDIGHQIPHTPGFTNKLAGRIIEAARMGAEASNASPLLKVDDALESIRTTYKAKRGFFKLFGKHNG
ncbi:uncharacterized protein EV422DRAFT_529470 [Fimicolochytrium jonesii]|uniref:uncharacterized protein n=1 Tax=Fimicolochytrium jonesii TaxID=1396493 RepID=UPI0022FE4F54|nr:uncharacterized protein EV422DRAFT_529470 [Fimicolochytrium jonesii]KAI8821170.1 hypothetical protein EV422DRAFT_529470 [Fimicolochytrium jonesii]